jgi:hypothetical protein
MNDVTEPADPAAAPAQPLFKVRLPGFVRNEDIGLGDVIRKASYAVGIRPCGGCDVRAATLNRWVRFTR